MGGIKGRKQQKRLRRRLSDWANIVHVPPGFHKPGSNKK